MRIKALRVDHYGPLVGFSNPQINDLSLVYGPNEVGKTLLIDALLRLLFRKQLGRAKVFDNLTRVTDPPEGYAVLEIDGEEVKIDRNNSLTKHVSITPTDFRNIFVVRDSDLSILNQEEYFTGVSEKLAGLRTSEINRIKKVLQTKGRLTNSTSSSDLANNVESGHIRSKVEAARGFVEEIRVLADELDAQDFERLEHQLAATRDRLTRCRQELDLLGRAKLRGELLKARSWLDELKRARTGLAELEPFNEKDFETWSHHVRDLKKLEQDLEDLKQEYAQHQGQLAELEKSLAERTANVKAMDERRRRIEDLLEPKVYAYENLRRTQEHRGPQRALLRWGAVVPAVMLLASLVGAVVQPHVFFFWSSAFFLAALVGLAARLFVLRATDGKLTEQLGDVKTQAARLGFEWSSFDGLLHAKGEFERELDEARRIADGFRVNVGAQHKHIETTGRRMRDLRQEMENIERTIATLKIDAGVLELIDYQAALREKNEHTGQKKYLEAMLSQTLGAGGDDDPVTFWEQKLSRRLNDLREDGAVRHDAARATELREVAEQLEATVTRIEEALKTGRQALRDLESKLRSAGIISPDDVVCRTSGELRQLEQALDEFTGLIETHKNDAQLALTILEDIEAEEKSRVIELFGEDRSVSKYFKRITGGKYDDVRFDPETEEMSARTHDGEWISAQKLSGGALDQLYLAIRLSIAESMFGEERSFFILDDPFIKSDIDRLKNQLQLLKTIAASGWQVLYFSAKKEVYDLLRADISAHRVSLIRLDTRPAGPVPEPVTPPRPFPSADLFSDGPTY
jgi:uncharacterized protein YhaN